MNESVFIFRRPFYVRLAPAERIALNALATDERRDPRDQAAVIIRQELERRGLLQPEVQHVPEVKPT